MNNLISIILTNMNMIMEKIILFFKELALRFNLRVLITVTDENLELVMDRLFEAMSGKMFLRNIYVDEISKARRMIKKRGYRKDMVIIKGIQRMSPQEIFHPSVMIICSDEFHRRYIKIKDQGVDNYHLVSVGGKIMIGKHKIFIYREKDYIFNGSSCHWECFEKD